MDVGGSQPNFKLKIIINMGAHTKLGNETPLIAVVIVRLSTHVLCLEAANNTRRNPNEKSKQQREHTQTIGVG